MDKHKKNLKKQKSIWEKFQGESMNWLKYMMLNLEVFTF